MPKFLIAYDGSEYSDRTLRDLGRAGLPGKAEAVVLTVADVWASGLFLDPAMSPGYSVPSTEGLNLVETALKEAGATASAGAEKLKTYYPHWSIRPESVSDIPAYGVLDKIKSWTPDLVVMGAHGRSQIGRLLFGSVSHQVLTRADCNIRISRSRIEAGDPVVPLRILVACDGSQESQLALDAVLGRGWPSGTAIRVVTVVDIKVSTAFIYPTAPVRQWMKPEDRDPAVWVERMLADQKRSIETKGFIAYTKMIKGDDPKRALLKEAEEWGADTIFAGSRGLASARWNIPGNVSTALTLHAHCSVEIVRRPWVL
jgi:nucleotide-binding universal stress UspA family protein